tara:strand:+ start:598 stop:912 length:315 start_codon:yes stop_codon:yes gene_type:complete
MKLLNEIPTMINWINKTHPTKSPKSQNFLSKKERKLMSNLTKKLYYVYLKEKSIIPHYIAFVNNNWKETDLYLHIGYKPEYYEIRSICSIDTYHKNSKKNKISS